MTMFLVHGSPSFYSETNEGLHPNAETTKRRTNVNAHLLFKRTCAYDVSCRLLTVPFEFCEVAKNMIPYTTATEAMHVHLLGFEVLATGRDLSG
jgi:hypothetical protein